MTHEVVLQGYNVKPGSLQLGTFDSYGIEKIHVTADNSWDGLDILAVFHAPNGTATKVVAGADGMLAVPPEATAKQAGVGRIVFVGLAENVQRITVDMGYNIKPHSDIEGDNPGVPTPNVVQQILQAALNAEQNSAEAKSVADGLRHDAANGKINGKDGAKGDKGETGTTPQLKIGEDNLWQVSYDNGATWVSLGVKATGEAGKDGEDGKNGLTPHIGENGNWWVGDTDTGVSAKGDKGDTGAKGADGVSPTASVTQTDDGAEFTVTDASGTTTATIKNGINGRDGAPGAPGKDAVVDATLTQAGQAADAKVTGEKIGELKEDTAVLQKRQNVLVGSETGNPISCNDAFAAPLCGLTVYGKSTQDGTPTPDAPVPIVSAGDSGSVAVKVKGKNRMPTNLRLSEDVECFIKKNTIIHLTFKDGIISRGGNLLFIGENNKEMWFAIDAGVTEVHRSLMIDAIKYRYLILDMASENVCLTWNASSPDYEPYREQLLTLPTPNGLPGIPVTSGGNYTDQNGQQWICDEVDLERGVKVQRVDKAAFDSTKTLAEQNAILATPIETPLTPAEIAAYKAITAYAPDTVVQASDGAGIKLEYQRDVNLVVKNLEDAIASMTTT